MYKIIFILSIFVSSSVFANTFQVADKIDTLTLENQFEQKQTLDINTKLVIYTVEKKASDLVKEALKKIPEGYFLKNNIIYIADISNMPGFISRFIAIPAMKERNYPIMLDSNGTVSAKFPAKEEKITLIYLNLLNIIDIKFVDTLEEIQQSLL
ncbi:MAG: hypothetical protein QM504_00685 [Pseudomonadota bacterium]